MDMYNRGVFDLKNLYSTFVVMGLIFVVMLVFYINVHPIVPFDTDDWLYMAYVRSPFPSWRAWNPTRIFPEVFMPFCTEIASSLVMPFNQDFVESVVIVNGVLVSTLITVYAYLFHRCIRKRFSLSDGISLCLTVLFLLCHFVLFRTCENTEDIEYLFFSLNMTSFYYYTIPNLLCGSVILYLLGDSMTFSQQWERLSLLKKGMMMALLYFLLFSNLYTSIVLTVYITSELLMEWLIGKYKFSDMMQFMLAYKYALFFLLLWLLALLFEANGGRSGQLNGKTTDFWSGLTLTGTCFKESVKSVNGYVWGIIVAGLLLFVSKWRERLKEACLSYSLLVVCLSMFVGLFYQILLSARVSGYYILRGDVIFVFWFYAFLLTFFCLALVFRQNAKWVVALPWVICLFVATLNAPGRRFKDVQYRYGMSVNELKHIDHGLIRQVKKAEMSKADSVSLVVPKFDSEDNWPIAFGHGGKSIANCLRKHRLIDEVIEIELTTESKLMETNCSSAETGKR